VRDAEEAEAATEAVPMPLIKSQASLVDLVQAPSVYNPRGALCLTCGRIVESEGVVEGYPGETTRARYLVGHHGAEEARWFDMGSTNWDYADVAQMARRCNWFDPAGGLGLGKEVLNAGDHDEKDDGEFKVVSDLGAKS
jgi:hypothetical protein